MLPRRNAIISQKTSYLFGDCMERKYVLVTGGSRGIGRATAPRFAQEGYGVIITYRKNKELAEDVVYKAKGLGAPFALEVEMDVTKPESIRKAKEEIKDLVPYINVLVNNAGIVLKDTIEEITLEDWEKVLKVNLTGPLLVTKEFLELLLKAHWASVVNVASIAGQTGNVVASTAYVASKAGLIGFTKRLAIELAPKGIMVNAVAPTFVETDMVQEFISSPEKRKRIEELHPLGIILNPEDVAEAILFLADPKKSRGINGHVLSINAGRYT